MRYIPLLKDTHCQDEGARVRAGAGSGTQCLLHRTLLLKRWTSPTSAPSVFSLPSSAGCRLSDSANPELLAGIISFIFNHLKILQCVTIGNEQQELGFAARQHSRLAVPHHIALSQSSMCSLSLPSSGFTPTCMLSVSIPTHTFACTHTHTYVHIHTITQLTHSSLHAYARVCLYILVYTHVHTCAHMTSQQQLPRCSGPVRGMVGPNVRKSIFILELGAGRRSALFIRKASTDCSPFSTLSIYLKGAAVKWVPPTHFITAATNIMSTYYIQNVYQRCHFWKTAQGAICSPTSLPEPQTYFWGC